jgi:hypothetical protein
MTDVNAVEAYYYGCEDDTGHHWWARDGHWKGHRDIIARLPAPSIGPYRVDQGFCPGAPAPSDRLQRWRRSKWRIGEAALHRVDGWTILSFWDNSIEKRPGGCSTFVAIGTHDYETMRAIAAAQFPSVWTRFKFELKLVEVDTIPVDPQKEGP